MISYIGVKLTPGGRNEGNAFGSVCLSVCLSVCMSVRKRNSKTISPIDLIVLHKKYYTSGSILF